MARWHLRSHRKSTGALLRKYRKKRRADKGLEFLETKIGEHRLKIKRAKGGGQKIRVAESNLMNLADKSGKITKTKIITVTSNPANPHYVRRNILTKGSIVKTELGLAKITSRPSQHGVINGILVEEKK
ncbi:MAG TPA: 30S ribosomal protein S8e [archaeon]|nr:30S ribosomal protein S8e [archaeon]